MSIVFNPVELSIDDFSPCVIRCSLFTEGMKYAKGFRLEKRYIYNYELEYFLDGDGSIVVDDTEYQVRKGDIMFRKPGQRAQGIMPYKCYFVTFNLLAKENEILQPKGDNLEIGYYTNPFLDAIPTLFRPPLTDRYLPVFENILKKVLECDNTSGIILKANILQLLYNLQEDAQVQFHNTSMLLSQHYTMLKKVIRYIDNNYDRKISLGTLAKVSNLSPNYFHRVFARTMGKTPNEYITKIRLEKAKELLVMTGMPVAEVASRCGFENIPYFSYVFKTIYGISPGEFRKIHSYNAKLL